MNRHHTFAAITATACLLAAGLSAQDAPALPAANPTNDTARLLAGLAPSADAAMVAVTKESAWQQHAKFFDSAWARLEKNQISKVRDWAATNIPDAFAAKGTAFYMFSGPDFLYADTFFPQASTYVLCGIEPIGPIPDVAKLTPQALGGELHALQESLNSVMSYSFFITKKMKDDFQNHSLSGTLPVLYIFLARSGLTLTDVSYVSLDEEGALTPQPDATHSPKSPAPGVRIHFLADGSTTQRTLYYFSTDISDSGLKKSGFLKFCKTLAPGNSCVKSASYLMHESYFSTIRGFLLDNTNTLVQDDSGIPISFFTPDAWQMRYFGAYPGPIPLFKNCNQPKLTEAYRTTHPVPLEFGIGYRHHPGESTLMVATRKPLGAAPEPPAAAPVKVAPPRAQLVPPAANPAP
ncbi:MAG: hypothetical protein WCK77_14850 [Verrucomicrobiota bacterium]